MRIQPVILSGGTGSRLWPLSRELMPKQFLPLANSGKSLLQDTLLRLEGITHAEPIIICNDKHRFIVVDQLREIGIEKAQIILEPMGKNTAPAVAVAALNALKQQDDILLVLPADHKIINTDAFRQGIAQAINYAKNYLVTFGIDAHKPETGYGYIEKGEPLLNQKIYQVAKFVEKPNQNLAQTYIDSGRYVWNSGMFMFQASHYLSELEKYAPEILKAMKAALHHAAQETNFIKLDPKEFALCPADSIDYAVMEHTEKAVVVALDCLWSDVGSWSSLWETEPQDNAGNALKGNVIVADTKNSYLYAENRMLVAVGLEDSVVIETKDAVLVANKNDTQQVKKIVEQLKAQTRSEIISHRKIHQSWGSEEILVDGKNYQVKQFSVKPQKNFLIQSEQYFLHLIAVQGNAEITVDNDISIVKQGESVSFAGLKQYYLANHGDVELELITVGTL